MSDLPRLRDGACLQDGIVWLSAKVPAFATAIAEIGDVELRRRPEGFAELLKAIMGQQVSVASANAIFHRLGEAGLTERMAVARASEDDLRACGLSRQKIRYAQALARSEIEFETLGRLSTREVLDCLTAVPGIGPWTAQIYAMFSLGHADVFAPGDLALQESARVLFDLSARPTEKEMREMAKNWSPWRSVAAHILWAHYLHVKNREGV